MPNVVWQHVFSQDVSSYIRGNTWPLHSLKWADGGRLNLCVMTRTTGYEDAPNRTVAFKHPSDGFFEVSCFPHGNESSPDGDVIVVTVQSAGNTSGQTQDKIPWWPRSAAIVRISTFTAAKGRKKKQHSFANLKHRESRKAPKLYKNWHWPPVLYREVELWSTKSWPDSSARNILG